MDNFWNQGGIDEEPMKWKRDGEWRGLARDKREQETLVTVKTGGNDAMLQKVCAVQSNAHKNALLIKW